MMKCESIFPENIFRSEAPTFGGLRGEKCPHSGLVNGAQSNRHDTASAPWRDGCARSELAKADRGGPEARPQRRPARASRRGAGRENRKECPAGLAAGKANGRDVCTVGAHSRQIARQLRGAVFEVTAFDGWSERAAVGARRRVHHRAEENATRRKRQLKRGRGGNQRIPTPQAAG